MIIIFIETIIIGEKLFLYDFKAVIFLKYLLLYFCLRYLLENKIISLKYFFISCTFASVFVSVDLFYQSIFELICLALKNLKMEEN